jgi:hypothetical protein
MGKIAITPVVKQGFSLVALDVTSPERLEVRFSGNADMEATPVLETYLKELHDGALAERLKTVVFDIADLDFMNSSSFKCFVTWVGQILKLPDDERYQARFLSNPSLQWQRRSLEALHRFAPDVVTIDLIDR